MAQRRSAPKRPARPARQPRAPKSSGAKVSGSVSVSPKFTLFGGSLFNFSFGGGGRRNRRRGGLFTRLTRLATRAYGEVTGKGSGPKSSGGNGSGRSFDNFRTSRPDLFDDQGEDVGEGELVDDDQEAGSVEGNGHAEGGAHDGPTRDVPCDFCGGVLGHHWHGCPRCGRATR